MARGFTRSVSNRVLLPLPSRLEVSITSVLESTQNIAPRWASTAKPSGLTRSTQQNQANMELGQNNRSYCEEGQCVSLLVLMSISGSAPGAIAALLIVRADKSVQQTWFSLQSQANPTTMEPCIHIIKANDPHCFTPVCVYHVSLTWRVSSVLALVSSNLVPLRGNAPIFCP